MALLIGDNFSYNGKKPNFERDSFETLAALKAIAEANIDNGHIAYCKETNKHYIFNDSNSADPLTGKWRELESEFINKVNISDLDDYVTDTELQEAISGVQFELPIATNSVLGGIKVGAGLSINPDTGVLSVTGGGTADAVDWINVTSKPQINGHDLVSGNNTLVSLGIQPAGNYALKSEIPSLSGYATESWVSSQGYLTSIPSEYITESELNSKGYLTSVPDNYVTDNELTEAINDAKYTLPIASTDTLGGIKIGAGLSITGDGILSATGGGVADSVAWENVVGRPINLSQFTNDSGFITSDDLPDLSDYALKSELPDLTDYALKSEIPDISGLATKSELSGYALKSHTHIVADITDFPEIPDVSNLATKAEVNAKQDALISGQNIKTINGTSLLGSGDITIESGGGGSEITDVLDDKTYGRKQGSWVDLTDWLAWAEYD